MDVSTQGRDKSICTLAAKNVRGSHRTRIALCMLIQKPSFLCRSFMYDTIRFMLNMIECLNTFMHEVNIYIDRV